MKKRREPPRGARVISRYDPATRTHKIHSEDGWEAAIIAPTHHPDMSMGVFVPLPS